MAQVVYNYISQLTNGGYIYDSPGSGSKTHYDHGTELRLSANYAERETNGYYPVTYPENGWVSYMLIDTPVPNYVTVTDKCTPPDQLLIAGGQMTIVGGAGGDLNTLTAFGVSWRERDIAGTEWGEWSTETANAAATVSVTANAGKVRQYRVRTQGSAGQDWYSDYVICETLVSGNTAAKMPTIVLPINGAVSGSRTPAVVVSCSADNEGDQMKLQRSIDGADWMIAATVAGTGGMIYDRLPEQTVGTHTIRYKLTDINGAESETVGLNVVIGAVRWTREIKSGDIISNRELSHITDLNEMLTAVNVQRLYYGLDAISLPGTVGKFADWVNQMRAMLDASEQCLAAAGLTVTFGEVESYPNAAAINELRRRITMV